MRIKLKDPYIQENGTLKNKLGIKEYDELNRAERDIGFVKLIDIEETFKQKYDKEYLKTVHIKRAIQMGIKKEQENQNKMLNNKEAVRESYEEAER